jgi:hypothetical protein
VTAHARAKVNSRALVPEWIEALDTGAFGEAA